ncbi:MAG: ankyrin repeat domain-containing protein [Pseudomonadota bacterium]|nr:ankyrin repeat domain-containing protein [Pseudomonadota bacterium]MDE3038662.1 ankyrin repeat domain-containing protein [Pseudomonadota bacterium]
MDMSSRILTVFLVTALVFSAFPARADSPKDEIIYRASLGRADDVRLLLKQGASPNEKNHAGVPLLSLAAARIDGEGINVAKVLVDAGADVNGNDAIGRTALFYAANSGNLPMVKYLLDKGIHYYAEDNNGTIARTLAFQAGHMDIVKAMDDFVKAQTKKVDEQYKKADAILAERYREEQKRRAVPPPSPPPPSPKPASPPENKAAKQRKEEDVKRLAHDLSFHACAFQYWYFVDAVKQITELSPDEMDVAIDSHKKQMEVIEKALIRDYGKEPRFVINISDSAQKRIYSELAALESNSYRHEKGVGRMDDVEARCQNISRDWDIDPADVPDMPGGAPNNTSTNLKSERTYLPDGMTPPPHGTASGSGFGGR